MSVTVEAALFSTNRVAALTSGETLSESLIQIVETDTPTIPRPYTASSLNHFVLIKL